MIEFVGRTAFIRTPDDLAELPDGSLISWLRIVNDETSRAVAFVHIEKRGTDEEIVWVSPGGWSPQGPADAGIKYPSQLVIAGDLGKFLDGGTEPVDLGYQVLDTGGTWPREKALDAASRVMRGYGAGWSTGEVADRTLSIAAQFADWLVADVATPPPPTVTLENDTSPGATAHRFVAERDAEELALLDEATNLRAARNILIQARDRHNMEVNHDLLGRMVALANSLDPDLQ